MADLILLVEDEQEADRYFVKLLKTAGFSFLAIALLPWGSMLGRTIFSWNFSGGLTAVLLVSAAVTLALGFLKNLPILAREV
jgi:hypothetical protein